MQKVVHNPADGGQEHVGVETEIVRRPKRSRRVRDAKAIGLPYWIKESIADALVAILVVFEHEDGSAKGDRVDEAQQVGGVAPFGIVE